MERKKAQKALRVKERSHITNEMQPDIFTLKYWSVIQPIMGDEPIQSVIQPVTIDTMLNNNGLNFVTCEQTLNQALCLPKTETYSVLAVGGTRCI